MREMKLIFLIALLSCGFLGEIFPAELMGEYVPSEIIVKFKDTTSDVAMDNIIKAKGEKKLKKLKTKKRKIAKLKLKKNKKLKDAIAEYQANPSVEYAQPNYIYRINVTPDDPHYPLLWGIKSVSGNDMDLESAWDIALETNSVTYNSYNCSNTVVAVIDTGINYNHEDLQNSMWNGTAPYLSYGYDFVNGDFDPMDDHGHGTHVAGTIGAYGYNGLGTTGICWQNQLMALKVMSASGAGSTADITEGVYFAIDNGAHIINMSLGGSTYDLAFAQSIQDAGAADITVVVAAGNDGKDIGAIGEDVFPCNYSNSNLICVAALDSDYTLATYSNYSSIYVDIAAPGTDIYSTSAGVATVTNLYTDTGWNYSGIAQMSMVSGVYHAILMSPYGDNETNTAETIMDLTGVDNAFLNFYLTCNFSDTIDTYEFFANTGGVSAFIGDSLAGPYECNSTPLTNQPFSFNLNNWINPQTAFGIQMVTNGDTSGGGLIAGYFELTTFINDNVSYESQSGTSMATPHVAGLAAMLKSLNPDFTSVDIINALKQGDTLESLDGLVKDKVAADAYKSLRYLRKTTGLAGTPLL